MLGRNLVAQRPARAVGIAMEVVERSANRGHRLGRRPDRILVGGKLGRLADTQFALDLFDRLAGLVGMERGNRGQNQIVGFYQGRLQAAMLCGGLPALRIRSQHFQKKGFALERGERALSPASSRWPWRSTKNRYSHGRERSGRDSIFEMLIRLRAKIVERLVERADLVAHREQRGGLVGAAAAGRTAARSPESAWCSAPSPGYCARSR